MVKDTITQGLSDLGSNISVFFNDLGEKIGTWFSDTLEDISEFNSSVGTWFSNLSSNLGNWFTDLGENIGIWFSDTLEDIGEFNSSVGTWFSNLGSNLGNWFSDLGTDLGNWFTDLVDNLKNLLSYINPFDENFLGNKLVELIGELFNYLFVPEEDMFANFQNDIRNKFYFTTQISDIFNSLLKDFNYGNDVPTFNISYYGKTLSIIDFSPYLEYRTWLHTIILAIAWFIFIRKTFNKIPKLIGGV